MMMGSKGRCTSTPRLGVIKGRSRTTQVGYLATCCAVLCLCCAVLTLTSYDTGFTGWYVDNVKEECDAPGEYFFDPEERALYYTFNGTEQPTGGERFSLTTAKILFNVSGTQANPVKNLTIRGTRLLPFRPFLKNRLCVLDRHYALDMHRR